MSFFRKPFDLVYSKDTNTSKYTNVLLIDNSVKNSHVFAESVNESTFPVTYATNSKKSDLLALLQSKFTHIQRIGIVFSSNLYENSKNFLDCKPFFTGSGENDESYSENVQFILNVIKEFQVKNIDYLACDTLNYPNWANYYSVLTKETGVTVGATNDKTGNIKYGGDWIMESTSQDIELIYFTKSIEYYTNLLDNLSWASGLTFPIFPIVNGSSMYVSNEDNNIESYVVSQINLADGSINNINWAVTSTTYRSAGLAISGSYMYVANLGVSDNVVSTTISEIKLSDGSINNINWASGLTNPVGLAISGSYLYVSNIGSDNAPGSTISKIDLNTGNIIKSEWATGLSTPTGLAISGSYLYVANSDRGNGSTISKIDLNTGNTIKSDWATGLSGPFGLAISGSNLYVSNLLDGTISLINLADGSIINRNWKKDLNFPYGMTISGKYIYVAIGIDGTISQFDLEPQPNPISNICFPANTPILTDQGIIPIEKINPDKHTINKKSIVDITKTITQDKYLVCFKKNALGINYPIERTIMSKDHKVYYQGEMHQAKTFVGRFENVIKVKYDGEILYNVLMEKHYKMRVNNLICETLHPENIIAKLHTRNCKYTDEVRDEIIVLLNECIQKKDYQTYHKLARLC